MNETTPLVSIITPVYGGRDFLAETIESVRRQTFGAWEHIFVDDCSPDDSLEVIAGACDPSRISIVRHDCNRGIAAARNSGLAAARGEYVAFLDQDDLWLPGKLEKQTGLLKARPDCGLCYARHLYFKRAGEGFHVDMVGYPDFHTSVADADPSLVAGELFMNNFIAAGSVVARKKALLDAGGFDENIGGGADDYDMWLRLCRSSRFVFLDSIQLLSRVHSSNFTERSRTADDTFIVLARAEKDLGIPAEIAGRSYARQYYKRCRFRFLGGDYAGAVSDLEKASSIPGPRARYRAVRALIRLGKTGALIFTASRRASLCARGLFGSGDLKLSAPQFETLKNGGNDC
jgi:glycosyltransferase involved in cell wall biosynthesis